ncbi:porin OmpC, partial [Escherichia coli]|nr:porin OmpC [Escherichia coli]
FACGLRPSVAYLQSKGKNLGVINGRNYDDEDILNYVDVGATYYFNKNMSTYVDYIINQIDSDNKLGVGSDDTVAVGIVYQF